VNFCGLDAEGSLSVPPEQGNRGRAASREGLVATPVIPHWIDGGAPRIRDAVVGARGRTTPGLVVFPPRWDSRVRMGAAPSSAFVGGPAILGFKPARSGFATCLTGKTAAPAPRSGLAINSKRGPGRVVVGPRPSAATR